MVSLAVWIIVTTYAQPSLVALFCQARVTGGGSGILSVLFPFLRFLKRASSPRL